MTEQGGSEWERNEAADDIAEGVQAADAEAIRRGASRLGDAVTNAAADRLIPTLKKTLESVVKPAIEQLNATIASVQAHQDQRFAYLIRITELEFKTNAAWRERYSSEIDRLSLAVGDFDGRLDAHIADIDLRLEQRNTVRAQQFGALQAHFDEAMSQARNERMETNKRLDAFIKESRTDRKKLREEMTAIQRRVEQIEARATLERASDGD